MNNDAVLQQLTVAISAQNKPAVKSNDLRHSEFQRQLTMDEIKKDQTKKIHPNILKMISCASAATSNDNDENLPASFTHFVNCENVGMTQNHLVHQFKDQGFLEVAFALGTMQALLLESSYTPTRAYPATSQFFIFHEQEPKSNNPQQDYLNCHLLQVEGQKKSLEETKTLLKQAVHVPSGYNGPGTDIQYFAAASNIFFSTDSICTTNLRQLLFLVSQNKKSFSIKLPSTILHR